MFYVQMTKYVEQSAVALGKTKRNESFVLPNATAYVVDD